MNVSANDKHLGPTQLRTPDSFQDREHMESLLDRALADTFPASDPVSSLITDPLASKRATDERQPKPAPRG
jgi:hypothetical protein